jgi:hypothetical protein
MVEVVVVDVLVMVDVAAIAGGAKNCVLLFIYFWTEMQL